MLSNHCILLQEEMHICGEVESSRLEVANACLARCLHVVENDSRLFYKVYDIILTFREIVSRFH